MCVWLSIWGSHDPSFGLINQLKPLTETQGNALISLLEDKSKDPDEQPDEDICRTKSVRVMSTGASVLVQLGSIICLERLCSPNWKLSAFHSTQFFMETLSHKHDWSLTSFIALLPSQDNWSGENRIKKNLASNHGLFFSSNQALSGSHPETHPKLPQ